jgi:hypothetical protein
MHTALSATSETLAAWLAAQLTANIPFFTDGTMTVSLNDPEEMETLSGQGLSLWLYRVVRDEQHVNAPPRRLTANRLERVPLPLRLYYLVTPVVAAGSTAPGTRQTVLGRVLQAFHDHPSFRGADLRGDLAGTASELFIRLQPMEVDELARIWDAMDRSYQLSVSYEVSMVLVRSALDPDAVTPVEVALPEWGVIAATEPVGP